MYVACVDMSWDWPSLFAAVGAKQILLLPVLEFGIQAAHFDPGCLELLSVIAFHTAPAILSTTHTPEEF